MSRLATRVLYIDDDRINTLLFVEACRPDGGLTVLTAANGADALELARETVPDILVVDLHMPDTDGLALLPSLRQIPGLAHVPAFLCTAERLDDAAGPAASAGFAGVWTKPVDLASIRSELARVARQPNSPERERSS